MHPVTVLLALALGNRIPTPDPVEILDASVLDGGAVLITSDPGPEAHLVPADGGFLVTWTDARRRVAFDDPDLGTDVWLNALLPDGGLAAPFGVMARRAPDKETLSHPRVACSATECVLAWQQEGLFNPNKESAFAWGALDGQGRVPAPAPLTTTRGVHRSLGLVASTTDVLATWETVSNVVARLRSRQAPFLDMRPLGNVLGLLLPTPSVTNQGFYVAWTEGTLYRAWVSSTGIGTATAPAPTITGMTLPAAAAPGPRVAVLNAVTPGQATLRLVDVEANAQTELFEVLPRPLRAASTPSGTSFISVRTLAGAARLVRAPTDLAQLDTVELPGAAVVHAVAADPAGAMLLMESANPAGLGFYRVPPQPGAGGEALGARIAPAADQLAPAVAWAEPHGWATSRTNAHEGTAPGTQVYLPATGRLVDLDLGERSRVVADRSGKALAVDTVSPGLTTVLGLAPSGDTLELRGPLLVFDGGVLPAAACGDKLTVAWNPEDGRLAWGRDTELAQQRTGVPLGRCGAWTEDGRLLLLSLGATQVRVLSLVDDFTSGEPPLLSTLSVTGGEAGALTACLAASEGRLFAAFGSKTTGITAWTAPVPAPGDTSVVLSPLPLGSSVDGQPGRNPVVTASANGWLLAWEDTRDGGSAVVSVEVLGDGGVTKPRLLSSGDREARNPAAASSPEGAVVLGWQEFDEPRGNALVTFKEVVSARDAGTRPTGDGGLDGDAGVDGGLDGDGDGDGGVDTGPVTFASCGCGAVDGAAVLLALALLVTRRRAVR